MYIFAHRGASAHAPENTIAAVELAIAQQADGIEIDVHQLGEEFVVIHDQWLSRTTNGNGHLTSMDLTELRKLDAGQGQRVPTLKEVMETVDGRCDINIEMKGISDPKLLLSYTQALLSAHPEWESRIIFSSFDHHLLKAIKTLLPDAYIGALTSSKPLDYAAFAEELGAYSVNLDVSFTDKAFVDDAKRRGLKVFVYTVDQPEALKKLAQWGVDGVFSNSPINSRKVLDL